MKIQFLLIPLLIFTSTMVYSQKETVQLPEIAKEIKKMRDKEQKLRIKWSGMVRKGKTDTEKFRELTNKSIAEDRANTARMREIIDEYGWPTYDLVGRGPSNNAWLIVQHADRNPLFQIKCLPLLKKAVDNKQANPSNYAYLYDRVQVAQGKKQKYATQSSSNNGLYEGSFYPLEDESNVQKNRESMGIERSVVEYAQSMGFEYTIPSKEEAKERADQLVIYYEKNLEKALSAMKLKDYTEAANTYLEVVKANGSVTTNNFIEAARALSLAKHEHIKNGMVYIRRAIARGWNRFDKIMEENDFAYLRESSEDGWNDLVLTAREAELDK